MSEGGPGLQRGTSDDSAFACSARARQSCAHLDRYFSYEARESRRFHHSRMREVEVGKPLRPIGEILSCTLFFHEHAVKPRLKGQLLKESAAAVVLWSLLWCRNLVCRNCCEGCGRPGQASPARVFWAKVGQARGTLVEP